LKNVFLRRYYIRFEKFVLKIQFLKYLFQNIKFYIIFPKVYFEKKIETSNLKVNLKGVKIVFSKNCRGAGSN